MPCRPGPASKAALRVPLAKNCLLQVDPGELDPVDRG